MFRENQPGDVPHRMPMPPGSPRGWTYQKAKGWLAQMNVFVEAHSQDQAIDILQKLLKRPVCGWFMRDDRGSFHKPRYTEIDVHPIKGVTGYIPPYFMCEGGSSVNELRSALILVERHIDTSTPEGAAALAVVRDVINGV